MNGPYVRRMIPELGDPDRKVPIILTGLCSRSLARAHSSRARNCCETALGKPGLLLLMGESIENLYYHRFSKLMNDFKRNKHFPEKDCQQSHVLNNFLPEWRPHVTNVHKQRICMKVDYTSCMEFLENKSGGVFHQDQPSQITYMQQPQPNNNFIPQLSFNKNYMQQPMPNPKDITDPTTAINMSLVLIAKAFKLNYSTPTNNPNKDFHQTRTGKNVRNQNRYNALQNVRNQVVQNAVQNPEDWVILIGTAQSDQGEGMLLIFRLRDLDKIEEVNANCILMANLQQPSISGTQTDNAPVYVSDGSAEVHHSESCYDNDIFNMFTQDEKYTELLEPIPKSHQVHHNDSNVISVVSSMEQSGGTVDQNPVTSKEAHALYDSLYNNLAIEVVKVNMAKSGEELYFSNTSKTATISKSISIPNEEFSDDTSPSVARKFLNEVKSTIVTLQRVVKQKMTLDIHNWSFMAHQEIHKIIKDEIFPNVNQVDARLQNFEIQFLKEAAKFVRDFKSLAKEADESLAKYKALEFEIERLLRAIISYDKAYNDMQQKFERLQAQLGDLKGKSKDTPCESDILDPLSQKLENENVELEFQVLNYAKENAHLKTTYKTSLTQSM
ncbi:hypothetical protein Tco_0405777 [Tanacetum coccineum]